MPNFLTPDLYGDGRSDLIIPFSNSQGNLEFFLSQSCGVGLTAIEKNVPTNFPWLAKSSFKAMDMTGTGVIDVVQIGQNPNTSNLSFRNFPGVAENSGSIGLGDAYITDTQYPFDNTIDWFLLKHSGTGAVSLVRVWQEFLRKIPTSTISKPHRSAARKSSTRARVSMLQESIPFLVDLSPNKIRVSLHGAF